jgi:hypothetical protein
MPLSLSWVWSRWIPLLLGVGVSGSIQGYVRSFVSTINVSGLLSDSPYEWNISASSPSLPSTTEIREYMCVSQHRPARVIGFAASCLSVLRVYFLTNSWPTIHCAFCILDRPKLPPQPASMQIADCRLVSPQVSWLHVPTRCSSRACLSRFSTACSSCFFHLSPVKRESITYHFQ